MLLHVGPFPQGMAARKRQGARPSGKQTKFNQLSAVRAACIAELERLVALAWYLGSSFAESNQAKSLKILRKLGKWLTSGACVPLGSSLPILQRPELEPTLCELLALWGRTTEPRRVTVPLCGRCAQAPAVPAGGGDPRFPDAPVIPDFAGPGKRGRTPPKKKTGTEPPFPDSAWAGIGKRGFGIPVY